MKNILFFCDHIYFNYKYDIVYVWAILLGIYFLLDMTQLYKMNCRLLALVYGVVVFITQQRYLEAKPQQLGGKNCDCTPTLVWDDDTQQHIGKCYTQHNDGYWCYVSRGSCSDGVESSKRPGLYYSYLACPNNQISTPQPIQPGTDSIVTDGNCRSTNDAGI